MKLINKSELDDFIFDCSIASYLAYLDPDMFYLKWNKYKDEITCNTTESFYSERECGVNQFLCGVKTRPIFYNGAMNPTITKDVQAYLIYKDSTAFITFRGTNNIRTALYDCNGLLVSIKGAAHIKVHNGFYKQFLAIEDSIRKDLEALNPEKIVFTGHSMGSSIATIASAIFGIDNNFSSKIHCVGFGCPRVGNQNFVSLFNTVCKNNWRITCVKDPVPLLPFIPGYEHVSPAYHIIDNSLYKKTDDQYIIYRIINFIYNLRKPIYNHCYDHYIQCMLKIQNA